MILRYEALKMKHQNLNHFCNCFFTLFIILYHISEFNSKSTKKNTEHSSIIQFFLYKTSPVEQNAYKHPSTLFISRILASGEIISALFRNKCMLKHTLENILLALKRAGFYWIFIIIFIWIFISECLKVSVDLILTNCTLLWSFKCHFLS